MLSLGKASRLEPDVEARDNGRRGHEKIVRDDKNSARAHVQSEHSVTVLPKYPAFNTGLWTGTPPRRRAVVVQFETSRNKR